MQHDYFFRRFPPGLSSCGSCARPRALAAVLPRGTADPCGQCRRCHPAPGNTRQCGRAQSAFAFVSWHTEWNALLDGRSRPGVGLARQLGFGESAEFCSGKSVTPNTSLRATPRRCCTGAAPACFARSAGIGRKRGDGDWGRRCPECGHVGYPHLSPATLILVHDGPRLLLAQSRGGKHAGAFWRALSNRANRWKSACGGKSKKKSGRM